MQARVERELKRDGFGRVEEVAAPRGPVVRRVACGGGVPGSRWVARALLRRERRALARLAGLPGVPAEVRDDALARLPSLDGRVPARGDVLLRSWVPGETLARAPRLPADFFERLEELVRALHARGVCHNDLHKEPNVLVAEDGYPALVDFQLASVHAGTSAAFASRCADDLRHVAKHARRYALRGDASPAAKERYGAIPRRSPLARLWRRAGKPAYDAVVHGLLGRGPSEERRANAGPWPEITPALGPRGARPPAAGS